MVDFDFFRSFLSENSVDQVVSKFAILLSVFVREPVVLQRANYVADVSRMEPYSCSLQGSNNTSDRVRSSPRRDRESARTCLRNVGG